MKKDLSFSVASVNEGENLPVFSNPVRYQLGDCDCACSLIQPFGANNWDLSAMNMRSLNLDATHVVHYASYAPLTGYKRVMASVKKNMFPEKEFPYEFLERPFLLSAWIHLTDKCNMRCDYCYLLHQSSDMSLITGRAVIDAIFRSAVKHHYRVVKLKYAGGEPLLCFSLLRELHSYAQELAKRHNLTLDGVVLSNGTLLTPEIVEQMQALGLRLMISLDGIGPYNNCQRHYANGKGSFSEVQYAIEMACHDGLKPIISITISGRNAAGLPEVVLWALERDLLFSLNFYRECEISAGQADLKLEETHIIEGMLAAYQVIERNIPNRSLLASLLDRTNLGFPHLHTCSVGQSYLVFNTAGQVTKCQMDMAHPITDCYAADPLDILRQSKQGIINPIVDEKSECSSCEWRYWCGGGCPLQVQRFQGNYKAKSPNCAVYQALFPAVIRLEGLRLLKYGGGQ